MRVVTADSLSAMAKGPHHEPDGDDAGWADRDEAPVTAGPLDRLRSAIRPVLNPPPSRTVSARGRIEGLDARERLFSFVGSGVSVLLGVGVYLAETQNHHFRLAKGQLTPQTTLVLGIVFGILLFVATLFGRRAPIGFVALFAFLAFGATGFILGLPFLALAAWLLVRSYKFQREAAASARAARADARPSTAPSGRPATGRGKPSARTGGSKAGTRTGAAKGPATPEANKRFTPKRPPPPAPKPSRRDRKAAKASD